MKQLIKGLRRFKAEYFCSHQQLFEHLSHGQHPRVLFITCSDSRVDPELFTQAEPGDIFVIRNAGNIIPPYGATNGGEGATIEYAIEALGIKQIVICGHSHCGAMKGLLNLDKIRDDMPLVYDWLKHAEATRRLIKQSYGDRTGEELLNITIAENVLTQIDNLRTYPSVHAKLYQHELKIYAWIFDIDHGDVMAYDPEKHAYVTPQSVLPPEEQDPEFYTEEFSGCALPNIQANGGNASAPQPVPVTAAQSNGTSNSSSNGSSNGSSSGSNEERAIASEPPFNHLSSSQLDRIYRGSSAQR